MKIALSTVDDQGVLRETGEFCFKHTPEPEKVKNTIYEYIKTHDKIVSLNASGLTFTNIDLKGKRFYGCCFQHCFFTGIQAPEIRARMSSFDFAIFTDCNLSKCNIQFTSFAGSKFIHTIFTGSDMIQNNFGGIQSYQTSFDDSDLYNSRFIKANLVNTSFHNCNIKKTIFYDIKQQNINFKMSNTNEAVFDERGSALFTGMDELDTQQGGEK